MPRTSELPILSSVDLYSTEANASTNLGQLVIAQDGRKFRYHKAGGTTTVVGKLQASAAEDTNFKDMAVQAAVVVNATVIPVTLGGTATTSGQFNQGYLAISVTPGIGQFFQITAHDVQTSTTGTCNFTVLEKVQTALTTSSKATVVKNPYDSVIVAPTVHTGPAVGGAVSAVTNAQFGWLQTGGAGACLSDATATAAATMALSASVTTAGTVTKAVAADFNVAVSISTVTVSAEVEPLFWVID